MKKIKLLALLLVSVLSVNVWGADETKTYTFSSKSWEDATSSWTSGKAGNGYTSGQGVQITSGVTGANATTKSSFKNVSKIVVNYCTNTSKGKGTIKVQVGSGTAKSYSVTAPSSGGTTLRNTDEFTFSPAESGTVKITVDCETNSIYINSITITTAAASTTITLDANSNGKTNGSVKYTVGNATPDATPTWVAPKDNTGWTLYGYYTAASGGTKVISSTNTLNTSASDYVDSNGNWKYTTATLTLHAQWGTTPCATPSNLGQNNITATSATLTWSVVTGAASYKVYIFDMNFYERTIDNINTNSITLDDLSPNTEYMWSVQAIGDASKGYADGLVNDNGDFTTEAACTHEITITKGTPSHGSFDLSQMGVVCIDDGNATVSVTNISPATHYHFKQITTDNGSVDNTNKQVTNISANTTINVEFTEDTKYTITFADKLHSESVAPKSVYENETFTFPDIDDKTAATSGTCEQVHYHFMGWVLSTHEGTIAAGDIKTGTSDAVSSEATYYAVWAKEEL